MSENPLATALKQFEIAEANLLKLEMLWREISDLVPQGIVFGDNPEYEDRSRAFASIIAALPKIDGGKPNDTPVDLDDIAQWRILTQKRSANLALK